MSNFEETLSKDSVSAAEYALATATHKALDVSQVGGQSWAGRPRTRKWGGL